MLWLPAGITALSASRRSSRTSQAASSARLWAPETTSFGNGARASSSRRNRASHGGRSTISARTPCSSLGESVAGSGIFAPNRFMNSKRNAWLLRAGPDELGEVEHEGVRLRPTAREPECRRLDQRERPQRLRALGGRQERHDPTVRKTDEMAAVVEQPGDLGSLLVEVDVLQRRVRRVATPVRKHERERIREGQLLPPRGACIHHAPVHENDARPAADNVHGETDVGRRAIARSGRAVLGGRQSVSSAGWAMKWLHLSTSWASRFKASIASTRLSNRPLRSP